MLFEILLSAFSGFCTKISDDASDKKLNLPLVIPALTSIFYGAALGILAISTPLSSLFLALAIASILTGKINTYFHILGLIVFTIFILFLPLSYFNIWLFSIFLVSGIFDELSLSLGKFVKFLSSERLFTPIASLLVFLLTGQYLFLFAIVSFDISYRFARNMLKTSHFPPVCKQ
ncbi:MAG: hypothetical protein ABIH83_05880 [Candidatus Micrarchaeota archaeon]